MKVGETDVDIKGLLFVGASFDVINRLRRCTTVHQCLGRNVVFLERGGRLALDSRPETGHLRHCRIELRGARIGSRVGTFVDAPPLVVALIVWHTTNLRADMPLAEKCGGIARVGK